MCLKCPKCGADIGRFDLAVNCKSCGVNLYVYSQERELAHDAKVTELDFAAARRVIASIKASFITGKLPIIRIVVTVLCIVVFLLPFAEAKAEFPFFNAEVSYGIIGVYKLITNGLYKPVISGIGVDALSAGAVQTLVFAVLFVVCILISLLIFLFELLSFLNITKMARRMAGLSIAGMVVSAACVITALIFGNGQTDIISFTPQAGGFAAFAVYTAMLVVNILIVKKNVVPFVKDVDLKRIELRKKVKAGEINIDDLSMPIFETAEEREARINAIGTNSPKKKKKSANENGGSDNG